MIGRPLIRLDSVESTQNVAFRLAELGAAEGTTILARYQSGGRGRAGRAWTVPPGEALLLSILLRPRILPDRLAPLSILVGDAIAATLREKLGLRPAVKWPNDVLINGRKVSGILIQTRENGQVAVVGIGINVHSDRDSLPPGATSIAAELGTRVNQEDLFRAMLFRIETRYRALQEGAIDPYIAQVNDALWLRDEHVTIEDATRTLSGVVRGVAPDGALLLDTVDGHRVIVSGEMTRGPRRQAPR